MPLLMTIGVGPSEQSWIAWLSNDSVSASGALWQWAVTWANTRNHQFRPNDNLKVRVGSNWLFGWPRLGFGLPGSPNQSLRPS